MLRYWIHAIGLLVVCLVPLAAKAADFPVGQRQNIILFGDSITGNGEYGQVMQDLIDQAYPERQIRVISHGSAGDTVHGAHRRIESDIIRWKPGWVLINFGINDFGRYTAEEYLFHYEALINRISRDTDAQIVIVAPLRPDADSEYERLKEYIAGLQTLAKKYHLIYAPLYETFSKLRPKLPEGVMYATDTVHPNHLGYWMMAETILNAMDFPLPKKQVTLDIPARRLTRDQSDSLAGKTFSVALPTPLKVSITNPPLAEATAVKAPNPVVIDGVLSEWELSKPMVLEREDQHIYGVMSKYRDRFFAKAYACYDANAFYFAIKVDDSQVRNAAKTRFVVDRDCIELCLDTRTPEVRAKAPWLNIGRDSTSICQYILAPASDETPKAIVEMGNGDIKMLDGVTVASAGTSTGYQIECRVPAANFAGGKITPGTQIGFDFAVVDLDRFDYYEDALEYRWTGSPWSAFFTREFGSLTLAE